MDRVSLPVHSPPRTRPWIEKGRRIRVLIVDDSAVIRRLISVALSEDPALEVVGTAENGALGLEQALKLRPDVLTLDVEMPEMDGLETLRRLRQQRSEVRVIMFSTLTGHGAATTLDALMLGADDYVTKPANSGPLGSALIRLRQELVPKIRQFFRIEGDCPVALPSRPVFTPARVPNRKPGERVGKGGEPSVVAIGVSTGGPNALASILPLFPRGFKLPILLVQHMPPYFTRLLADRLQSRCQISVVEGTDGMAVTSGKVIVAPGDFHMRVVRRGDGVRIALDQAAPENSCRPAVDVLFRSVAEVYQDGVIAAVLTGMGHDGMEGARLLKQEGAYVIAQDRESSVVWGMPGAVAEAGLADSVLDLGDVVPEILRRAS